MDELSEATTQPDESIKPVDHGTLRAQTSAKLNQLRAGVLGANDGIVSVAGLAVGVAAATPSFAALAISGGAALVSGALSMAMGEYVSVSTQKDTERAVLERLKISLRDDPEGEREALIDAMEETGIPRPQAEDVSQHMSRRNALDAHARLRFGVEEETIVSPMAAALASLVAFTLGGLIPLLAVLLAPVSLKVPLTFVAVIAALGLTGYLSALLGQAMPTRATIRTIIGGSAAMGVTYLIGTLLGVSVG